MKIFTKKDWQNRFKQVKQNGQISAARLGQSIINRAEWREETRGELPFLITELRTLKYTVQLQYIGRLGDYMQFSLVDLHSPEGGCHGYPKLYFGGTGAFVMELVSELSHIDSLHHGEGR